MVSGAPGSARPWRSAAVPVQRPSLAMMILVGMVLVAFSLVLPNPVGQIIGWAGYAIGFLGWLGLPVCSVLLGARVFIDQEEQ
jgi:hypothetical protein